ncbi:hypothetical protein AAY473_034157, partial [Plecturocebus cupreus]
MGFHYVDQAGLELLTSSDPSTSASQSAGITGVSHCVRPGVALSLRLECTGMSIVHCSLKLLNSSDPPTSAFQAGLELLVSSDPPALASYSTGIPCVSHYSQPCFIFDNSHVNGVQGKASSSPTEDLLNNQLTKGSLIRERAYQFRMNEYRLQIQ